VDIQKFGSGTLVDKDFHEWKLRLYFSCSDELNIGKVAILDVLAL
jgi:hypothetical protein